jgi:hypothetical protein
VNVDKSPYRSLSRGQSFSRSTINNASYRHESADSDVKPPNLTCVAGVLTLLLSILLTATAQQNKPWESKLYKEDPATCGIIVTFKPKIEDALLVPNEVIVDVPLQLHATKVIVQSYPRGTGVGDIPNERLASMYRFQKVGKYARFRGEINKCTDQGSVEVDVLCKGFEHYPIRAYMVAVECRPADPKASR